MVNFIIGPSSLGPEMEPRHQPTGKNWAMEIKELKHQVARIQLLNQTLWELLRERLQLTDADFEAKLREIDLRDGREDGEMSNTPVKCPQCGRISSSRHWRCIYCGLEFEKPVMG